MSVEQAFPEENCSGSIFLIEVMSLMNNSTNLNHEKTILAQNVNCNGFTNLMVKQFQVFKLQ